MMRHSAETAVLPAARCSDSERQLIRELEETRARLAEAESTLDAIRSGAVDAVVVSGPAGGEVFTRRGAREPFGQLIEHLSEGALVLSRDGFILYSNKAFARMLQAPMDRILGEDFAGFLGRQDQGVLAELLEGAWVGSSHGEVNALAPNGAIVPLRLGLRRLQMGAEVFVAVVATDLTEAKRREEELRQSEQRLQMAVAAANLGAWEIDLNSPERNFLLAEPYVAMFGRDRAHLPVTEDQFLACIHPEDRDLVRRSFGSAMVNDATFQCEFRILWPDRTIRWHATLGRTMRDARGRPMKLVGVGMDVTRRRELEAELRQSQKLEGIGQLAGGVAHDFNNILSAMLLQIDLLGMNDTFTGETRQALSDLTAQAHRASDLTRQLLMFSRRSVLSLKRIDLNRVAQEMIRMLSRVIGEEVDLRLHPEEDLPPVEADAGLIEQVVMNLVVNARDAMPGGGRITLRTTPVTLDLVHLAQFPQRRPGSFVCLTVCDTGSGMSSETMKRIFEPFFTTKEVGKGTGLGLATVHGIVAQHKGWVEVESAEGVGTTFRVFLPAADAGCAATAPIAPMLPFQRGTECILVVEDEPMLRQLIAQALRVLGYKVYEAEHGREAMACWESHGHEVDLLLSDTVLPGGMSGLQLAERLVQLKPGLKIIMTSGYSTEIGKSGTVGKAGFVYLPKPYEMKVLTRVVRSSLVSDLRSKRHAAGAERQEERASSAHAMARS
jgi:PAS domain S-box-containing protein